MHDSRCKMQDSGCREDNFELRNANLGMQDSGGKDSLLSAETVNCFCDLNEFAEGG